MSMTGFIGTAGLGVVPGSAGAEPTVQTSDLVFSSVTDVSFVVSFTAGDGNGRLVVVKSGGAVDATPADGINYNSNTIFGDGDELGTGNFVVYAGSGSSVTVTGLTINTTYHVRIFEYNQPSFNYLTSTATDNPLSQTTDTLPSVQATDIIFSEILDTEVTFGWTRGNGSHCLVLGKASSAVNSNPVNNTTYTANSIFGSGDEIGTGNFVLYKGTGNSVNVTGLTLGLVYHFRVYEFAGGSGAEDFLTDTAFGNPRSQVTDYFGPNLYDEWFANYGLSLRNTLTAMEKWKGYRNGEVMHRGTSTTWTVPSGGIFTVDSATTADSPNLPAVPGISGSVSVLMLIKKTAESNQRVTLFQAGTPTIRLELEVSAATNETALYYDGVTYNTGYTFPYDSDFHALMWVIDDTGVFRFYADGVQYGGDIAIASGGVDWTASATRNFFTFGCNTGSLQYKKIRIYNEAVADAVCENLTTLTNPFTTEVITYNDCHVIGFWGQSNMVGSGLTAANYPAYLQAPINGAYMIDSATGFFDTVEAGVLPTNCGPLLRCMYDLVQEYPNDDIFCMQTASASQSLDEDFSSTVPGPRYTTLVTGLNKLIATLDAEGRTILQKSLCGMQGEEDARFADMSSAYETNLEDFNTNIRLDTGVKYHVYGRLSTGQSITYRATVATAQTNVGTADAEADYIDTDDNSTGNFEMKADALHFNAVGEETLGAAMAAALIAAYP